MKFSFLEENPNSYMPLIAINISRLVQDIHNNVYTRAHSGDKWGYRPQLVEFKCRNTSGKINLKKLTLSEIYNGLYRIHIVVLLFHSIVFSQPCLTDMNSEVFLATLSRDKSFLFNSRPHLLRRLLLWRLFFTIQIIKIVLLRFLFTNRRRITVLYI